MFITITGQCEKSTLSSLELYLVKTHKFDVPCSVALMVTSIIEFVNRMFGFTICERMLMPLSEPNILLTDHLPLVLQSILSSWVPPKKFAYFHLISLSV